MKLIGCMGGAMSCGLLGALAITDWHRPWLGAGLLIVAWECARYVAKAVNAEEPPR